MQLLTLDPPPPPAIARSIMNSTFPYCGFLITRTPSLHVTPPQYWNTEFSPAHTSPSPLHLSLSSSVLVGMPASFLKRKERKKQPSPPGHHFGQADIIGEKTFLFPCHREAKKPSRRKELGEDFLRCEIPKYVTAPAVPYFNLNAHLAPNMYPMI